MSDPFGGTGESMTTYVAMLKEWYTDRRVEWMVYQNAPTYAMMPKNAEIGGETYDVPLGYGDPQAGSARFSVAQGGKGPTTTTKFQVEVGEEYSFAQIGRKVIKPSSVLLGDPLKADSAGNPKDLPFALHWIELLARMGMFHTSPTAQRILTRLLKDCDEKGVWSPKNLRATPKSASRLADFAYPLEGDGRTIERRKSDVTFRLALIAKLLGWELEYV